MNRVFDWLSWLVTVRPWVTLAFIAIRDVGVGRRAWAARGSGGERGLPPQGSGVAKALEEIETSSGTPSLW